MCIEVYLKASIHDLFTKMVGIKFGETNTLVSWWNVVNNDKHMTCFGLTTTNHLLAH